MGIFKRKEILSASVVIFLLAHLCQADYGAQDLQRQARALRQKAQRPLRPVPQGRAPHPLLRRSGQNNNRFDSFGLTEGEYQGKFKMPVPPPHRVHPESNRDGAQYDDYGNRVKYANQADIDRRADQTLIPDEDGNVIEDAPRPLYRYPRPQRFEGEQQPSVASEGRVDQKLKAVIVDSEPQDQKKPFENLDVSELKASPQRRVDDEEVDLYSAASGPATAESNLSPAFAGGPNGIPLEQRDLEAAIVQGAEAYGAQPNPGVYQTEDRLSFQIHGQQGPHSYKYGYDTGNGYNRQFRYEERDKNGYVVGRYGFYDQLGKLQVVNYSADPVLGFHAEGAGVPEYPH